MNIIEPLTSLFSFGWIPSRLCCLHDLCLKVTQVLFLIFLLHNYVHISDHVFASFLTSILTPSYSMVGSIGAVGATVNLSGLLEVEVLQYIAAQHNYNHTIA